MDVFVWLGHNLSDKSIGVEERKHLAHFLRLKIDNKDHNATLLSPSPVVDAFWHAFILHTKEYRAFCAKFCGPDLFLDHRPEGEAEPEQKTRYLAIWLLLPQDVRENVRFWPKPDAFDPKSFPPRSKRVREEDLPSQIVCHVKSLTGTTVVVRTRTDAAVKQLKDELYTLSGIPSEQAILVFNGRPLNDDFTLGSYNIRDGSILHSILNLRGC